MCSRVDFRFSLISEKECSGYIHLGYLALKHFSHFNEKSDHSGAYLFPVCLSLGSVMANGQSPGRGPFASSDLCPTTYDVISSTLLNALQATMWVCCGWIPWPADGLMWNFTKLILLSVAYSPSPISWVYSLGHYCNYQSQNVLSPIVGKFSNAKCKC